MKRIIRCAVLFIAILTFSILLSSCKEECYHQPNLIEVENLVEATETQKGSYDRVVRCNRCGKEQSRAKKTLQKLSCLHKDENDDFSCDKCSEYYVSIHHKNHVYDREVESEKYLQKAATCTDGAYYYTSCGCGKAGKDVFTDGLIEHTFEERVDEGCLVSEATCASPAIYYKSCVCGETTSETFKSGKRLSHIFENNICTLCQELKRYERDGVYVYFGEFPQTLKSANVSITNAPSSGGVYIGSDGERYLKVTAKPDTDKHTDNLHAEWVPIFSNGEAIVPGKEYYFKIEPIRWRIIHEEEDNTVILRCDSVINAMAYGENLDYFESNISSWLNGEFYNEAFSEEEKEIILDTSPVTGAHGKDAEGYVTQKAFLLDSELAGEYYTAQGIIIKNLTSDFSRAIGVYFSNNSYDLAYGRYGEGKCWLKPLSERTNSLELNDPRGGVVPFIKIELR